MSYCKLLILIDSSVTISLVDLGQRSCSPPPHSPTPFSCGNFKSVIKPKHFCPKHLQNAGITSQETKVFKFSGWGGIPHLPMAPFWISWISPGIPRHTITHMLTFSKQVLSTTANVLIFISCKLASRHSARRQTLERRQFGSYYK